MAETNARKDDLRNGFLCELVRRIGLLFEIPERGPDGFQDHFERRAGKLFDALLFGGLPRLFGF